VDRPPLGERSPAPADQTGASVNVHPVKVWSDDQPNRYGQCRYRRVVRTVGDMPQVSAAVTEHDGVTIVALRGDLTGPAVLRAQSYLAPLLRQTPPILVVDLSGLDTCDCTGALMLMVAAQVAADCGGEVRLAAPPASVIRALRQAGTVRAAGMFGTVPGAVHADRHDLLAAAGLCTNEPAATRIQAHR
jgi:anti-sigma B factor antagonist